MSHTITLYTQLKNSDLHAISAFEAITDIMGISQLKSLRRFGKWTLTLDTATEAEAKEQAKTILDNTYYLINPNKESYTLGDVPHAAPNDNQRLYAVEVSPQIPFDDAPLKTKIQQKVGITVASIDHAKCWTLLLNSDNSSDTDLKTLIDQQIVLTQNQQQGLLVNPLYETYTLTQLYATSPC